MEKLKPCPFCGSDDMKVAVLYGMNFVECRKCGSSGSRMRMRMDAIKAWNNRAERTCHLSEKHPAHSFDGQARDCLECGYEFDCDCGEDERFYCCPGCGAKVVDGDE